MKALLEVGDRVRIRQDISPNIQYKMKITNVENCYLPEKMCDPGELVTIMKVTNYGYKLIEEDFYTYTDEMFDQDIIEYLYEEYLENEKELYEEFVEYNNK